MFGSQLSDISRRGMSDAVAVIGLGRFGGALALELMRNETDVLGIDHDQATVQRFNGKLTSVVRADATDEDVLRELSVDEFERVVVGIGSNIEASILTASRLVKFGCPGIWAKALTEPHAEILTQLGVQNVVNPESDMGTRAAHLVQHRILDFVPIDDGHALVRCTPPEPIQQRPMDLLNVRQRLGVSVVAVCRPGGQWEPIEAGTMLYDDDQILVTGPTRKVEHFSNLT
ncbi:TrkA family potassium uptake protein [Kocuria rhizophila]|uniref:potassium channel family protein n=1 Tax=Kocuria TaxID=57493 RepID=UPI0002DE13F6|nr:MULTISPECIES: TrkA family potassium uptake protein [Kocuria]WIW68327.1 TrkA family potassium uptake protein [Kocuria sp. ChxB]KMK73925.1 potassium transporter [Kocuria rhizophila]MCG7425512.1 TrkA family potassium uptake protein [Kocuria rhizophila]MCR4525913.1 TrkA family potassium uptake protein [Kocuria rhizophila]MCT1456565.1 TrkA family potassium uptake protein [Kocuria rhizophila]